MYTGIISCKDKEKVWCPGPNLGEACGCWPRQMCCRQGRRHAPCKLPPAPAALCLQSVYGPACRRRRGSRRGSMKTSSSFLLSPSLSLSALHSLFSLPLPLSESLILCVEQLGSRGRTPGVAHGRKTLLGCTPGNRSPLGPNAVKHLDPSWEPPIDGNPLKIRETSRE